MKKNIYSSCFTFLICAVLIVLSFPYNSQAEKKPRAKKQKAPDVSGFMDSAHHWYDIFDQDKVVNPLPGRPRYKTSQVSSIADNILLYQKKNGGWPKNYDMQAILTKEQKDSLKKAEQENTTTFDNGSTYSQIEYLAQAYEITRADKYRDASIRGIEFILGAQYSNGGWPQFYPDTSGYRKYITLNDGAMTGIMKVLNDILTNKSYYSFIPVPLREKIKSSFDKALDCLFRCQITQNGKLTAWCQQHDNVDFHPQSARNFEPAAICSQESSELLSVLMDIENPDQRLINSIKSAVEWLDNSKLKGIRVKTVPAPRVKFIYRYSNTDHVVVSDPKAPPIWPRFYEIETNKPLFCNRDKKVVYSLAEVERERRDGYSWYNYEPSGVIKKFQTWKKKYL